MTEPAELVPEVLILWQDTVEVPITEEPMETEDASETETQPESEEISGAEEQPEKEERQESETDSQPELPADSLTKPIPKELPESVDLPELAELPEPAEWAELPETVQIPETRTAPAAECGHTETIEQSEPQKEPHEKRVLTVKQAAKAAAITTGCLGGVAGIYAGLVYLFAMAEIDTIGVDGRKKRLCRLQIRSEKGHTYRIELGKEVLKQCETDRICIRLSAVFVHFHKNCRLVVKAREKSRTGCINREVYMTLPSF